MTSYLHKSCSTSPPGWVSKAHTCAALSLARRNARCRQRTRALGTTSYCQGVLVAVGLLNMYDIMLAAHNVPKYITTRKWRVLKAGRTLQVATQGAASAVYDCLVAIALVRRRFHSAARVGQAMLSLCATYSSPIWHCDADRTRTR